jgi:Domain of unknown function (DU1801)
MPRSTATTAEEYLLEIPDDRRATLEAARKLVKKHLPKGYAESISFGMLSYEIPLAQYPGTYNKRPLAYVGLAAQKNYCALYLMGCYMDPVQEKKLKEAFRTEGLTPDMGKSCVRFQSLKDLPVAAMGEIIASTPPEAFIRIYEQARAKG